MSFLLTILTITALNGVWTYEDNNTIQMGIYAVDNQQTLLFKTSIGKNNVIILMKGKVSKEGDLYTLMFVSDYSDAGKNCQERTEIALSGEITEDFEYEYLDSICVVMFVKRCPGENPTTETKDLSGKWKRITERK